MCKIYSNLLIKTLERCKWTCFVFLVDPEQIFTHCSSVSIDDFEQKYTGWVIIISLPPVVAEVKYKKLTCIFQFFWNLNVILATWNLKHSPVVWVAKNQFFQTQ